MNDKHVTGKSFKLLLRAIRGARNPILQVVLRMRRMYVAIVRLDFQWNEWNE